MLYIALSFGLFLSRSFLTFIACVGRQIAWVGPSLIYISRGYVPKINISVYFLQNQEVL